MTRRQIEADRAAAMSRLRERSSLSRADYDREVSHIQHEFDGRLDRLARGEISVSMLNTVLSDPDRPTSASKSVETATGGTGRKLKSGALAKPASNNPLSCRQSAALADLG